MKVQPASRKSAPVAEFDPDNVFALVHLLSVAAWPPDSRRRGEAMVTWAASINGINESVGFNKLSMEALITDSAAKAAAMMGLPPETLLALPHAREIVVAARALPGHVQDMVETQLFNPGGGWPTTANAAYQGRVGERYDAAGRAGIVAGYIILFCAQLREYHPQITAGYNRAFYMVERLKSLGVIPAGADRKRKEAWKEFRCVGHIWAAIILALEADRLAGAAADSFVSRPGLKRTLGWAQWFRDFATKNQAQGAQHPLVRPHEAVELRVGVTAEKPPLQPLSGPALTAAREYKAPLPSQ
jgi:hypothetical protein